MSPASLVAYCHENDIPLMHAVFNNSIGYRFAPLQGCLETDGAHIVFSVSGAHPMKLPTDEKMLRANENFNKMMCHPEHLQAAAVRKGDEWSLVVQYDRSSRADEHFADSILANFLAYAGASSVEDIEKIMQEAERLYLKWVEENKEALKSTYFKEV